MTSRQGKMLAIDGSFGEGGGQVLRTALALSAVTKTPVRVENIRLRRPKPGLQAQHLTCIKAVGELCNAEVSGLSLGSAEVTFHPGDIAGGTFSFDVGTAGSMTLVLQALLPPALHAPDQVEISLSGGTDVAWSPPVDYFKRVLLPLIGKAGCLVDLEVVKRGYYPHGGGVLRAVVHSIQQPHRIALEERGILKGIEGVSHASYDIKDRSVAERQNKGARMCLFNELSKRSISVQPNLAEEYSETHSTGSGLTLWTVYSNTLLGASALGEKSKKAEDVGSEAAQHLMSEIDAGAAVDSHMADQILPYLALFGGVVRVPAVPALSQHAKTNIHVINQFGFNLKVEGNVVKSDGWHLEK